LAKIPRFFNTRPVRAGTVGVKVDPGLLGSFASTGREGKDLIQLGGQLKQLGAQQTQIARADLKKSENAYLNTSLTGFQLQAAEEYETRSKEAFSAPKGFSEGYNKWFTQQSESILAGAPSSASRERMQNRLTKLGGGYLLRGNKLERSLFTKQRINDVDTTSNALLNRLSQNPNEFQDISRQLTTLAGSLSAEGVSPETVASTKKRLFNTARVTQLDGRVRQDPRAVLE